jgi:hypothetical protein
MSVECRAGSAGAGRAGGDVLAIDPRAGTGARDGWTTSLTGDDVVIRTAASSIGDC